MYVDYSKTAELHLSGTQPLVITSGAIAFGKQKLHQELFMSRSMRQITNRNSNVSVIVHVDQVNE